MRHIILLAVTTLSVIACTSSPEKAGSNDTGTVRNDATTSGNQTEELTLCFQKLDGTANQDTTSLRLIIDGDQVSGDLAHYPKEKDKRVGRIQGIREGELIKGQWIYMQEGMNDTLPVEFKLNGQNLIQKNYTVDPKTGREVFSEASAFNIEFASVDCEN